jgi:hypothetical protein
MNVIRRTPVNFSTMTWSLLIIFCLETLWHSSHVNKRVAFPYKKTIGGRIFISICAAWVVMFQEAARFISHIQRGYLQNLFWRFDWVCGKNPDYVFRSIVYTRIKAAIYISFIVMMQKVSQNNSTICRNNTSM